MRVSCGPDESQVDSSAIRTSISHEIRYFVVIQPDAIFFR